MLETAKIFDFYKKCNNRKIRFFKEKMFSEILKIPFIENREEICELLFNNNDLTITNFGEYSDLISNYFAHVLIKFNNIKEKEYFKNLMTKIVSKFSNDNLVIAFNKFNENFFDNYESMQYFLELLIINFDNLKHYEKYINKKSFESLNYLISIDKENNKEEIVKQIIFEKLVINIFFLLLNTNGELNPKKNDIVFETIKIFMRKINNKNLIVKIFYLFFVKLFENKKTNIVDINPDYFSNLKIIPLNCYNFQYLSNVIKLFLSVEPELEIINLLNNYFTEIFYRFFQIFLSKNENIISIDSLEKEDNYLLCNFYHIFQSNEIYYEFYFYLIKYTKKINNNSGIIKCFQNLKEILMSIFNLCPNPFYFEILIKSFQDIDELKENLIYVKEILDTLLDLDYIDLINKEKQKIILFNTIQVLHIFFLVSKDKNILSNFFELGLVDYILKFFENLKKSKYIFLLSYIPININNETEQHTILEICFDITISIFFTIKDYLTLKKFYEFFLDINDGNTKNEFEYGKSIVFYIDIINKELNIINNEYLKMFESYQNKELENILLEKNYKKNTNIFLIEFLIKLQMIKQKELEENNLIFINENSLINKFINLFIDDLLILIKYSLEFKKSKNNATYNSIIDSINKNNYENQIITKPKITFIIEDACQINKIIIKIIDEKNEFKNFVLYNYISKGCLLKEKCLLLTQEAKEEENNTRLEESKENINSYFDSENSKIIKCFKKDLLLKDCSIYFDDIYFYDNNFIKIKNSFYYNYESNLSDLNIYDHKNNFLKYPSKLKNFSSNKYALPKIFLCCNTKLYQNNNFSLLYPKIKHNLIKDIFPNLPSHYRYSSEILKNSIQTTILKDKLNCELIAVKHIIFGEIIFYEKFLMFKSDKNEEKILKEYETNINYIFGSGTKEIQFLDKIIIIFYDEIEEIFNRCFAFIPQALEIFLKNGKSYFFNFFSIKNLKLFYDTIYKIKDNKNKFKIVKEPKSEFEKLKFSIKWENGEIDNDQYLLYLNKYSGRSYNDINQYPIFPWVTLNQNFINENNKLKENDIIYRNMKYFMFTQTEEGRNLAKKDYINSLIDDQKNPTHFRFHYSTGGYILLYLMRILPFMDEHIRLQENNFDSPNRMVYNLNEILKVVIDSKDIRELIPEFFTSIEYFLNLNFVYFGKRESDKEIVNNIIVPQINLYRQKIENFIYFNKVFLNNNTNLTLNKNILLEKCKINKWIDLVFGYEQYPKDINKYNALTKYSNRLSFSLLNSLNKLKSKKLDNNIILKKMTSKKLRILYFGQTPEQMFTKKHCKYNSDWKENALNKDYNLFENMKGIIKIITFWISEDKDYIFFLIKNIRDKNIYIFIYDDKMNKKYEINIGKIKLYNLANYQKKSKESSDDNDITTKNREKGDSFKSFIIFEKFKSQIFNFKDISQLYILNPRDAIIDIFDEYNIYFIIGRNKDNTIKIFTKDNTIKGIMKLNSFVSVLHKKDKENFFSGHMNGTLIEWKIDYKKMMNYSSKSIITILNNIIFQRQIKAHNNALITNINYNERHNIILTSDNKGILYIRKYYDFELLTKIQINENHCFITQIVLNDFNLIYTTIFSKKKMKKCIYLYTLNGIVIEKSNYHSIIDTQSLKSGKIIFNRLNEANLFIFGFNKVTENNEHLIMEDILKKIECKSENFDYIMNFIIRDNTIYMLLQNGQFIKGNYDSLNLVCYGIN